MNSTDAIRRDRADPRQELEDDAVLAGLGEAAFAAALTRGRQLREEFAAQTAAAVSAAMQAEKARRS